MNDRLPKDGICGTGLTRRPWMAAVVLVGVLLAGIAGPRPAAADPITSDSLLEQSTLVINQQSNVYSFTAPGPGTLVVQLDDIVWPLALQSLGLSINSTNSVMGSMASGGTLDLSISHAGTFFADVSGLAGGPLDLGLYSLEVDFIPQGAPVPLPGALVLLLAGLALFGAMQLRWERKAEFSGAT